MLTSSPGDPATSPPDEMAAPPSRRTAVQPPGDTLASIEDGGADGMTGIDGAMFDWDGPGGLPRFERIASDDFEPAFDIALETARAEIDAISADPDEPTFDNTITALELAGRKLGRVSSLFRNLLGANADPVLQALEKAIAPRLSRHASRTAADSALFARVDDLWSRRDDLELSIERTRVLERIRTNFVRGGATLDDADRAELADLLARLSELGAVFGQNLLADERDWTLPVEGEAVLDALPESLRSAMRGAARERGLDGHLVTTSRSLMTPFLSFCPDRSLRERAFAGWTSRGARGGTTDNRTIIPEILALRARRAALLGYPSFAAFKLEDQMAGTPDAVLALLERVWAHAVPAAEEERAALERCAADDGAEHAIAPWDWAFYAAKVRRKRFALDPAALAPHFSLEAMIGAAFDVASRLFGLRFERRDWPAYHPDVRVWEVRAEDGTHRALFLGDYFARPSKRSGAWMGALRVQHGLPSGDTAGQRPFVVNVMNFARPNEGEPALLSFDDARTLFHEFGHALHGMLSDVVYPSVAGTAVARDFVELPSQLYEHWLTVPDVLSEHARHVVTGEPLSPEVLESLLATRTHEAGFDAVEFTASALMDIVYHTTDPERIGDVDAFEHAELERFGMPEGVTMRHRSPHFAHVFTGDGYSSGYYSYLWSEVLDADAFVAFDEAGSAFDPRTARRLRDEIYARGGSRPERDSYLAFRGAMPNPDAMLRNRGLAPHDGA